MDLQHRVLKMEDNHENILKRLNQLEYALEDHRFEPVPTGFDEDDFSSPNLFNYNNDYGKNPDFSPPNNFEATPSYSASSSSAFNCDYGKSTDPPNNFETPPCIQQVLPLFLTKHQGEIACSLHRIHFTVLLHIHKTAFQAVSIMYQAAPTS